MEQEYKDLKNSAEQDFTQKRFDDAIEKYQKVAEIYPDDEDVNYKLIECFSVRGQFNLATEQFFSLLEILEQKKEYQKALDICQMVTRIDPENIKARMKTILINQKQGNKKEVIGQSLNLARLLIEVGQGDQSIKLLTKAQDADPDNLEIGLELAEVYMSYGHIPEATLQYKKVAESFVSIGNMGKAIDSLKRLKLISPNEVSIMYLLGKLLYEDKKYSEAENEFRSILRMDLNNIDALKYLGLVCQGKGELKGALLACNKILTIDPKEDAALEMLADVYIKQGNTNDAIKNLLNAAKIKLEKGQKENSIKVFQKVLLLDPTNPTACRELTNLGAPLVSKEQREIYDSDIAEKEEIIFEEKPVDVFEALVAKKEIQPEKEEISGEVKPPVEEKFIKEEKISEPKVVREAEEIVEAKLKEEKVPVEPAVSSVDKEVSVPKKEETDKKIEKPAVEVKEEYVEEIRKPEEKPKVAVSDSLSETKADKKSDKEKDLKPLVMASRESSDKSSLIKTSGEIEAKTGLIRAKVEPSKAGIGGLFKDSKVKGLAASAIIKPTISEKINLKQGFIDLDNILKPKFSSQEEIIEPKLVRTKPEVLPEDKVPPETGVPELEKKITESESGIAVEEKSVQKPDIKDEIHVKESPAEKIRQKKEEFEFNAEEYDKFIKQNKTKEAVELLRNHISQKPLDFEKRYTLANLYYDNGMLNNAVFEYLDLIKADPENMVYYPNLILSLNWLDSSDELIHTYWRKIDVLKKKRDFENIIDSYQKILTVDSENHFARIELADLYVELGFKIEAIFHYKILSGQLSSKKDFSETISVLEKIFNLTGDLSAKLKIADLHENNNNIELAKKEYMQAGEKYREKGSFDLAVECFNKIVRIDERNDQARESLIDLYKQTGKEENAVEEMFMLSVSYIREKKFEKARDILEDALKLDENYVPALQGLIDVYFELGNNDRALRLTDLLTGYLKKEKDYSHLIKLYEKIIQMFPNEVHYREELSEIFKISNEKDKALEEIYKVIEALRSRESWDELIRTYQKAIDIDEKNSDLHYKLGLIYLEKADKSQLAEAEFEKAFLYDKSNVNAGYLLAELLFKSNRTKEVMNILLQLKGVDENFEGFVSGLISDLGEKVAKNDNDNISKFKLGMVYIIVGRIKEAIIQFQKTRKIPELQAKSYNMLGICFVKDEKLGIAIQQLEKGLEVENISNEDR